MEQKSRVNNLIDKSVNFIFSKDNRKWLFLIFIIGLILRILLAIRNPVNADEMVHGTHSIGFINSGKLQIMDEDAVWFWLTDLMVKLIGSNLLGLRSLAVILGALSIILIYFIGKEMFNEKVGLFASILFAISAFQLIETRAEMDIAMMFFILFAVYFFTLFLKTDKKPYFFLTFISLGIALMTKQIAITFIPAFFICLIYFKLKNKKPIKWSYFIYGILILLIAVLPIITFNYLLYKDKGLLDLQFARFSRVSIDTYSSIIATIQPFSINTLLFPNQAASGLPGFVQGFLLFAYRETLIITILAVLGLGYFFMRKNEFKLFLILLFLGPFIFLSGTSLLSTHFVWGSFFISLLAAISIATLSEFGKNEKQKKMIIYILFAIIILFLIVKIQTSDAKGFFGNNELNSVISFKEQNIPSTALVVTDSRIYRGQSVFMFWNRHYIEGTTFMQALQQMSTLPGQDTNVDVYYLECATTDCGWGTIQNQPDLNLSMTSLTAAFKSASPALITINGEDNQPYFRIYKSTMGIKSSIFNIADSQRQWFFYPVNYQPHQSIFDNYEFHNTFDRLLNEVSYVLLIAECILAIIIALFVLIMPVKSIKTHKIE